MDGGAEGSIVSQRMERRPRSRGRDATRRDRARDRPSSSTGGSNRPNDGSDETARRTFFAAFFETPPSPASSFAAGGTAGGASSDIVGDERFARGDGREERAVRCARATDRSRRRQYLGSRASALDRHEHGGGRRAARDFLHASRAFYSYRGVDDITHPTPLCDDKHSTLADPHAAAALAAHAWSPTPASSAAATFPLPPLAAAACGAQKTLAAARTTRIDIGAYAALHPSPSPVTVDIEPFLCL